MQISTDKDGNVYIAGNILGTNNFIVSKYNTTGVEQWTSTYTTANTTAGLCAMVIDDKGDLFLTGTSEANTKITTIKLNNAGIQQWIEKYSIQTGTATALATDGKDIYVTGYTLGTNSNYITIKYDKNGVQQWATQYNGTGNSTDEATAIALDKKGDVYVTGKSSNGSNYDYATLKYDSKTGVQQWAALLNGTGNSTDQANAIASDAQNNVYVTGFTTNTQGNEDYTTVSYSPAGQLLWLQNYDGPAQQQDYATAIAIDQNNNAYVTGASVYDACTDLDYLTIKYQQNGTLDWVQRYNGANNGEDIATNVVVDGEGNVYVGGESFRTNIDIITVRYSNINEYSLTLKIFQHDDFLKDNLNVISLGILDLSVTSQFQESVYKIAQKTSDIGYVSDYYVSFEELRKEYSDKGLNLKQMMKQSIINNGGTEFDLILFNQLNFKQNKIDDINYTPRLFLPYKNQEYYGIIDDDTYPPIGIFMLSDTTIFSGWKYQDNQYIRTFYSNDDLNTKPIWLCSLDITVDKIPYNTKSFIEAAGRCTISSSTGWCNAPGRGCKCYLPIPYPKPEY